MTETSRSRERSAESQEQDDQRMVLDGLESPGKTTAWLARVAGVGLSVVSVGFVFLFVFVLGKAGEVSLFTRPLSMRIVLAVPNFIAILTVATTIGVVLAWWNRYWSLRERIHQTLLALLGIVFSWQLAVLGFL